ncbi:MAG: 50S ribosomal protein L35 [Thermodesulfovibrionales bacterium]|nr:50S ribosomal protein L35 [Thermodesulfovibrionales bacterium]
MPKLKTHRGAAKRFKVTGSGKISRNKAYRRHILTSKNRKRKRGLKAPAFVDETHMKNLKRLLPYLN